MEQEKIIEVVNEALNEFNHIEIENQFLTDLIDNFQHFREEYSREQAIGFGGLLVSVKEIYNPELSKDLEIIGIMLKNITKLTEVEF